MKPFWLLLLPLIAVAFMPGVVNADVVINEIMYNPAPEQGADADYEWVELHNTGPTAVNVAGWKLRDGNPDNLPFVIPSSTPTMEVGGYLVLCSNVGFVYFEYDISNAVGNFADDFGLSNDGETISLLDAFNRVVDQVTYNDRYPWPDQPDSEGPSLERVNPLVSGNDPFNWAPSVPASEHGTPGEQNSLFSDGTAPHIVINEIHYHPASSSEQDEYVELYNASGSAVDLGGWQFTNGISFEFPQPTVLADSDYLAVCKSANTMRTVYGVEKVIGDFALDSSLNDGGETVVLRDDTGRLVDFVPFGDRQYWPFAADGYGGSLECINPDYANNHQGNWSTSSVTQRWVYVETAAAGGPTGDFLYFYLGEEGEALLDDVALVPEGGGENLIANGDFEVGEGGWEKLGNHSTSGRVDTTAHGGTACLKIVSTGDGGGGEWRNYVGIAVPGLSESQNYVLSFWAKPIRGDTRLTARVANASSIEGIFAIGDLAEGGFLSTPGAQNTAYRENVPPFVYHVQHSPGVPNPRTPVWVTAGVIEAGTVSSMLVEYTLTGDWSSAETAQMYDDGNHSDGEAGDGEYGAQLPLSPSYSIVRYRIIAEDDGGAVTVSPDADDMKSSYAYFCYDNEVSTTLPIYFLFVSEENIQKLEQLGSRDDYVRGAFVYDGVVYDDVGVRLYGSFSERIASKKRNWRVKFNAGEKMNGLSSLILLSGDYEDHELRGTAGIREGLTQRVFRYAGCAYSETQHVHVELNGDYYGLMLQVERPDTDYLERNLRNPSGDLFQAQSQPGQSASNLSVLPAYDDYVFAYDRKTNRLKSHGELIALIEGLESTPDDQIYSFFDTHLDIQQYASYLAAVAMTQSWVSPSRDYYMYFDEEVTGLWEVMPWGGEHNWESPTLAVLNGIEGENAYSLPNKMRTRFLNNPDLRTVFADRLRHLLDTTYTEAHLFSVINLLKARVASAADYDRSTWWPDADSLDHHVAALKTNITARRAFLYWWLDAMEGPDQPLNLSPFSGADEESWPITLVSSEFSGLGGSLHEASQWMIREENGLYSGPVWDSGEVTDDKTSIRIDPLLGEPNGTFFWQVRHKDDAGTWSLWSNETWFAIGPDTTPPSVVSVVYDPGNTSEVLVRFSEPVEATSAETSLNYWFNGTTEALTASLSPDGQTVTLTIAPGTSLNRLEVSDVSDTASTPNYILPGTKVAIEHLIFPETKINFQPDSLPAPAGYLKDTGALFDAVRGYGWTSDITDLALQRNIEIDERLDTLVQFGGDLSAWELALPSPARYRVTVCIGDPASESIYDLEVEGDWATSGLYLAAGEFPEVTREVDVIDGNLSLYGGSVYRSTRVAYVHVLRTYRDGDADLIDDVWEIAYFGSVEACDPNADPDSDGATNYAEYLAWTNPLSGTVAVHRIGPSGANPEWLEITWKSASGSSHRIHWSEELSLWNVLVPDPADLVIDEPSGNVTWIDKGTSPGMGGVSPGQALKRFYKVEIIPGE